MAILPTLRIIYDTNKYVLHSVYRESSNSSFDLFCTVKTKWFFNGFLFPNKKSDFHFMKQMKNASGILALSRVLTFIVDLGLLPQKYNQYSTITHICVLVSISSDDKKSLFRSFVKLHVFNIFSEIYRRVLLFHRGLLLSWNLPCCLNISSSIKFCTGPYKNLFHADYVNIPVHIVRVFMVCNGRTIWYKNFKI